MPISISFGGQTITRPGAYAVVDSSTMYPVALGGFKVLAFIGVPAASQAAGVPVGTTYYFSNPVDAAAKVGDCDTLECMKVAWAHGADLVAFSPVAQAALDADWQTAIDALTSEDIDGIVPISATPAIWAKVDAHNTLLSSVVNRRERRAFYGHEVGASVVAIAGYQVALNTERSVMATPAVYAFDATGTKVLKPAYYLAAAYAGIWAGQPPQEPITYKYVKFPGLEKIYTGTEITTLLASSIAPTEYVKGKGYRIVQGVTMIIDADLTKCELSVSTLKDVINQDLRGYFEDKYVGKAGVDGIEVTMYNDLVSRILEYKKSGWISGYVPETVSVTKNGTTFTLGWEGKPTLPINNFLMTSHFTL